MRRCYKRFILAIIGLALVLSFGTVASAQAEITVSKKENLPATVKNAQVIQRLADLLADYENELAEKKAYQQVIQLRADNELAKVYQWFQSQENLLSECNKQAKSLSKDSESKELSDEQVIARKKLIEECFEAASKENKEPLQNYIEELRKVRFMVGEARLGNIEARIIESRIQSLEDSTETLRLKIKIIRDP